jgi:hypothetical protein
MGWVLAAAGVVATIQGVAWMGAPASARARVALGVVLGCVGITLAAGGLVHALLPSFFTG